MTMSTELFTQLRFEIIVCVLIFLLLVLKLADADKRPKALLGVVNALLFINFAASFLPIPTSSLFNDFFRTNDLVELEKTILNLGVLLIPLLATRWLYKHAEISIEFYILMLSSLLGGFITLSSGHVLMLYLGIEISTIPIAALANFNKSERRSSEAGIKFILSSAFSTGMLLFGISLLYGAYGNLSFSFLQEHLTPNLLTLLAFAFMMGGFFFKMSAVPFHLWAADVYEGAPMAVTSYLSVVSKCSIVFVFVSILMTVFRNLADEWLIIISVVAILSMTVGNLFAMRQQNLKRLLGFSSISQIGFVLVGITGNSILGLDSTLYFMLIYILSNICFFGVLGAVADATGKEDLNAFKGFYRTNPFLALMMGVSLLSLAGIPPTSGFFGKLFLLASAMGDKMYILIAFAGLNLVISVYNYLRIIKYVFLDQPEERLCVGKTRLQSATLLFCCIAILCIGFISSVYQYIDWAGRQTF